MLKKGEWNKIAVDCTICDIAYKMSLVLTILDESSLPILLRILMDPGRFLEVDFTIS